MSKKNQTPAPAAPTKGATFTKPAKVTPAQKKGKSTVENPVGVTWVTCLNAEVGGKPAKRADLHRAAMAAGVAYYTTRTQVDRYLRWDRNGRDPQGLPQGVNLPE